MTIQEKLDSLAVHTVPQPFDILLGEVHQTVRKMQAAATAIGVGREFTPDGRFVGDIGEVIAKIHFGLDLHSVQKEGEDAVCQISGKCVEIKIRTKDSPVWIKRDTDFLIVLYLNPKNLRWGVVWNGPGDSNNTKAAWNGAKGRFETTLSKLLKAKELLPVGTPFMPVATLAA